MIKINKTKKRKFYCPSHPNEIRMLNYGVELALCPVCYKMMIPEGGWNSYYKQMVAIAERKGKGCIGNYCKAEAKDGEVPRSQIL